MHSIMRDRAHAQLAQLLPMEENFLLLFRFDNPLDSSVEFMKVHQNGTVHRLYDCRLCRQSATVTTLNC